MPINLFIGMYVDVQPENRIGERNSDGGRGIITSINAENDSNDSNTFDVKYILSNLKSPIVKKARIRSANFVLTGRRKTTNGEATPSLLSHLYGAFIGQQLQNEIENERSPTTTAVTTEPEMVTTASLLRMCIIPTQLRKSQHPVIVLIKKKNDDCIEGWLRANEKSLENSKHTKITKHLSNHENSLILKLMVPLKTISYAATSKVAYAWGVDRTTIVKLLRKARNDPTFTVNRKKRSDTGLTILNSAKKRDSVLTAKHIFKRQKYQKMPEGQKLTRAEWYSAWMSLSDDALTDLEIEVEELKERCQTIMLEIADVLKITKGSITWRELTRQITGDGVPITNHNSLCRQIMRLPGSSYTTTKLLPKLNKDTVKKRLEWANAFFLFWKIAKEEITNTKILLVHMDEKWFFSTVVRRHRKFIPFLGMEKPTYHRVHKKSHLNKEMNICSSAFMPHDNDIASGGLSYTLSCQRVGHYAKALKNTYRRVYDEEDGSFTYPPIEENILRRKGERYFKGLEINGVSEGTEDKPKYSLKRFFEEKEIPRLESLTENIFICHGVKVVVRYQMDGAGPHVQKGLLSFLYEEFNKRGWMLVFQPPNSPICNVKDACVFPLLSKAVSALQATVYNNKLLEGDEINNCVQRAWNELQNTTLCRTYLHHHQIAAAIVRDNGGDDFMQEGGGLHCGVRRHSTPLYDEEGKKAIGIYVMEEDIDETIDEQLEKWKYKIPDVSHLDPLTVLLDCELRFLHKNLPRTSELWSIIDQHFVATTDSTDD